MRSTAPPCPSLLEAHASWRLIEGKHALAHSVGIHKPALVPRLRIPNAESFHHHIKERRVSSKATVFSYPSWPGKGSVGKEKMNFRENLARSLKE